MSLTHVYQNARCDKEVDANKSQARGNCDGRPGGELLQCAHVKYPATVQGQTYCQYDSSAIALPVDSPYPHQIGSLFCDMEKMNGYENRRVDACPEGVEGAILGNCARDPAGTTNLASYCQVPAGADTNLAFAKEGGGYCDAEVPTGNRFIKGACPGVTGEIPLMCATEQTGKKAEQYCTFPRDNVSYTNAAESEYGKYCTRKIAEGDTVTKGACVGGVGLTMRCGDDSAALGTADEYCLGGAPMPTTTTAAADIDSEGDEDATEAAEGAEDGDDDDEDEDEDEDEGEGDGTATTATPTTPAYPYAKNDYMCKTKYVSGSRFADGDCGTVLGDNSGLGVSVDCMRDGQQRTFCMYKESDLPVSTAKKVTNLDLKRRRKQSKGPYARTRGMKGASKRRSKTPKLDMKTTAKNAVRQMSQAGMKEACAATQPGGDVQTQLFFVVISFLIVVVLAAISFKIV